MFLQGPFRSLGGPAAPAPSALNLRATFNENVLTMEHAGQLGEPFWLSIHPDRYDHGLMGGYTGNHIGQGGAPETWDGSLRYYKVTGPATIEEHVAVAWGQHVSAGDHTPVVPPVAGSNRNNSFYCTDNYPSLCFKAMHAHVVFAQNVADIKAGTYIRGNQPSAQDTTRHWPQTEGTETYIDEPLLYTAHVLNPRMGYCDKLDIGVSFGASQGSTDPDDYTKLRIYRRTTDPDKPYACDPDEDVHDLTGQISRTNRARNECGFLGTKFYVGGGEGGVPYTVANDVYTLAGHGLSNGAELPFFTHEDLGIPAGLVPNEQGDAWGKFYYVINVDGDSFQISETRGGSPFTGVADGTAVTYGQYQMFYIELDPDGSGTPQTPEVHYVSGNYANGHYTRWGQLIPNPLNDTLIHIGKEVTVCDTANDHAWSDVSVSGYVPLNNVQGWFNKKYNSCFFRGTKDSDTQAVSQANSCFKFHSISFSATPLNLGAYTDQFFIDDHLRALWRNRSGDFKNLDGDYQDESNPYATITVAASDPDGTEYTSGDLTSMMAELEANRTFAITARTTSGGGLMSIALANYSDATKRPKLVITKTNDDVIEITPNFSWDFTVSVWDTNSAEKINNADFGPVDHFSTIGAMHVVWPEGLAVADIADTRLKMSKVATSGSTTTYGLFLLAPHPVNCAPASTEWDLDQETTTDDEPDAAADYADFAADMPATALAAGWQSTSDPLVAVWGSDPRVQPDHMGGAIIKMAVDGTSHKGMGNSFLAIPTSTTVGVMTCGVEFDSVFGDLDRTKMFGMFSGNASDGSDVGSASLFYGSKYSSQNPDYEGGVVGAYWAPLTNSDNHYYDFNIQQVLFRRKVHYDVQILHQGDSFISGVPQTDGVIKFLVDGVLVANITGLPLSLTEDCYVAGATQEAYVGGSQVATREGRVTYNNLKFRAGTAWIDPVLHRFGLAA